MEIIEAIKEKFQVWLLIQRDKYLKKEIAKIPSDNPDDYYFDNLTNQFVYKDSSLNIQIGWQNTLNVVKTQIETLNISVEKLEAIIDNVAQMNVDTTNLQAIITDIAQMNVDTTNLQAIITDIAQMNVDTTNLQAIIANIGTINTNITNLQAIIADIANIETLNTTISGNITSLTAIIANIGTMNTNIANLQAIITDIANIETLNTTISGNITSLTAIIANIGTINTNIANLQAIITDIANIETQNISMNTALATINTNIGTINTAITSINAHQIDIDVNIASVKNLDIDISEQVNKSISYSGSIAISSMQYIATIDSEYLFNALSIVMKANDTNNSHFDIYLREVNNVEFLRFTIINNKVMYFNDYYFPSTKYIKIYIENKSSTATLDYSLNFYYTQQTRDNSFANKCLLGTSETQTYYFTDTIFLNRLSYIFQHGSTSQSYTIKVYSMLKASGATYYAKLIDKTITGSASEVLSGILSFPETTNLKVEIIENLGYASYAELNLFFSKNLKPELDKHIETSNIHFLESSINLANLNEKLHASLTEVSTSQHHVKTVASELNLANLNEKLHASLTEVSTSQHHVKTVASELNLANLNEKSYNSLTDKPSVPNLQLPAFPTSMIAMTMDNTWKDVDISATYGAKKHLVFLHLFVNCTNNSTHIYFNDNTANTTVSYRHLVANNQGRPFLQVHTDSNGIWSYKGLNTITVAAYCILGVLTP